METVLNESSEASKRRSDFSQLVSLSLPLMLSLCATNLVGFFDRAFLAKYSLESLQGYVSGFVLAALFQIPLTRLATLGQSFVSFYDNSNEHHRIGQSVWQMIWFSLLSMLIAVPVGYVMMPVVFGGSPVQEGATQYFTYLLWGNFLFPLQTALSSFFIGQKKANIVFITMLGAQCLHILLDYLLIFGVENYIPSLGIVGAAVASICNQVLVCGVLFSLFLRKKQRLDYGTGVYQFNWKVFFAQMRSAVPLSIAPFISISAWVAVSRLMAMKGGDYLTVFSLGSTLTVCFAFMNDALFQAVLTLVSGILGKRTLFAIPHLIKQAFLLLVIMMSVLALPFILYPEILLSFLFSTMPTDSSAWLLFSTCYSSWLFILCEGVLFIGMGLLAATRQTGFFIFTACLQWITGYLFIVVCMDWWHWQPETFWLLICANALFIGTLYFLKAKQLITAYMQEHSQ